MSAKGPRGGRPTRPGRVTTFSPKAPERPAEVAGSTTDGAPVVAGMRLNKYLSERGLCSRREADAYIEQGRVTVNGAVATLGTRVNDADDVRLDGTATGRPIGHVYIALHKPVGVECTTDRNTPHNVVDFVAHAERIFPIGRLDKDSEGLLLLTNDGDIVNALLRIEHGHEKEYVVTVDRPLTPEFLQAMAAGVPILDTVTAPCRIRQTGRNEFRIVLTQGLNRQIRRMCDVFGYTVRRLIRVRFINIWLDGIEPGRWRNLKPAELAGLLPERFGSRATPA
jgi:23S rRNA pseudouridine2604 synthase